MTYNVLKLQHLTRDYQKKHIKKYFGDRFVCFLNNKDKRYISYHTLSISYIAPFVNAFFRF